MEEEEEEEKEEEDEDEEGEGEKGSRRRRTRRSKSRRSEAEHNKPPQSAGVVVSAHLEAVIPKSSAPVACHCRHGYMQ